MFRISIFEFRITILQHRSAFIGQLVAILAIFAVHSFAQGGENAVAVLEQLFDDEWEFRVREDPLFATRVGDYRFNHRLPWKTLADQQRRTVVREEFLKRLEAIDRSVLPHGARINYDIFERLLRDHLAEASFHTYLMPITNLRGFHIQFPELRRSTPLESVQDFEDYIDRLRSFDRYTSDHIELMRRGIEQGLVLPDVVLEDYERSIESHIVDDATKSLLYEPFTNAFPVGVSVTDQQRLRASARKAIEDGVVRGYQRFLSFMEKEYVRACRGSISASALPQGRAFYRHRVRRFTTLDVAPAEVHEKGLKEVQRIREEMEGVIRSAHFQGDREAWLKFLRTDAQFYATTADQLMREVAFVLKRMDGQLPRLFKTLPRAPYGIRPVPDYIAPRTTTAYYELPSGDGTRAGFYYVNTYNLKSRPLFEIEALSLHEAVPGHHLQLALQQELEELPKFRRYSGFTAFSEGWALYAERLGLEVGFYQDPYSDYGRLSYEMWRACRLVVDTGIHYFGWTRRQAIEYMADNTALSLHNIEAEVDRYIVWPGQALAYKTGEMKIRQLRQRAEEELGNKFDIREFHAVVLSSGSVPLSILEDNVRAYIRAKL